MKYQSFFYLTLPLIMWNYLFSSCAKENKQTATNTANTQNITTTVSENKGPTISKENNILTNNTSNTSTNSTKMFDVVAGLNLTETQNTNTMPDLSSGRSNPAIAKVGNKVIVAGGEGLDGKPSNKIDIYEYKDSKWENSFIEFPNGGLTNLSVAVLNNKAFFIGGYPHYGKIYIYDATKATIVDQDFDYKYHDIATVAVGDSIFFAGGNTYENNIPKFSNSIYRLDIDPSGTIKIGKEKDKEGKDIILSQPRSKMAVSRYKDNIIFAGGATDGPISDVVDIYNVNAKTIIPSKLPKGIIDMAYATIDNKFVIAGGIERDSGYPNNIVKVYELSENDFKQLPPPKTLNLSPKIKEIDKDKKEVETEINGVQQLVAITAGKSIFFAGGFHQNYHMKSHTIDVYDSVAHKMITTHGKKLNEGRSELVALSFDDKVIFAGGRKNDNSKSAKIDEFKIADFAATAATTTVPPPITKVAPTPVPPPVTRIDSASTNAFVGPQNKMISGILISGGSKRVMVRASTIDGMVKTKLEIVRYPNREPIAAVINAIPELTQKKLYPANPMDSATIVNLPPGLYTMEVSSENGGSGHCILEVYDMTVFAPPNEKDPNSIIKIDSASTNAFVGPKNMMISGILISGGNKRVMVRASTIDGMVKTKLEIVRYPNREPIAAVINAIPELTQKKLYPDNSMNSATIVNLPPGLYTMEVSSENGGSGPCILEVYDMAVFP